MSGPTKIPGYYWDDEKQRYFKIQPNHLAPINAKYSKGNIKIGQRQTKKRKVAEQKQRHRERYTVKRNVILQQPLVEGVGLSREHGSSVGRSCLASRDAALVSAWLPQHSQIESTARFGVHEEQTLTDATFIPETGQMVFATSAASRGEACIFCTTTNGTPHGPLRMTESRAVAAFNAEVTALLTHAYNEEYRVLVCSAQRRLFTGRLPSQGIESSTTDGIYLRPGGPIEGSLGCVSMNRLTGKAAIAYTGGIFVFDTEDAVSNLLGVNNFSIPAIDWLDTNTVAVPMSILGDNSLESIGSAVCLWDTRTAAGVSNRFILDSKRITGLLNPGNVGHGHALASNTLLVSTQRGIALHDIRMPKTSGIARPMLSFRHEHGGPELDFASHGNDLFAAVDRDNIVQMYSLRQGKNIGALSMPKAGRGNPRLKKLSWYEHPRNGPTLQAVRADGIVTWTWGGVEDDEA